jgi:hypothetical protein
LALRALSLARAGADPAGAATVLAGLAGDDRAALVLACARCQAATEQSPGDRAAGAAVALLTRALRRGQR